MAARSLVLIRQMQLIARRRARGLARGAAFGTASLAMVALAAPVFASPHMGRAVPAPARGPGGKLTAGQLAADLRLAVSAQNVPSNLRPSLAGASDDLPVIGKNGCQLTLVPVVSKPCVYGDTTSQTSVVLFGDSHAAAWFPALNAITKRHRWRLLIFSKDTCPAEEVNIVRFGRPYPACPIWRSNAMRQIAAVRPTLVVVASSQYVNGSRPLAGVPTGHGGTWQNGVAAIFNFLHHAAQRTLYITDVPMLRRPAPDCLSADSSDVRACTVSTQTGFRYPRLTADELKLAAQAHIDAVDTSSWFCTSTRCPVIVGNIMLYRDAQHMTPQWSAFLTPLLDDAVTRVMTG